MAMIVAFALAVHYPARPATDDALRFIAALEHFSLVAQQPHFPGYPGLVWLADWLHGMGLEGFAAFRTLSLAGHALTAVLATALVHRATGRESVAWATGFLVLSQPLGIHTALSGLSDAPGNACLVAALYACVRRRYRAAAWLIGFGVIVRPGLGLIWLYLAAQTWLSSEGRRAAIVAGVVALPLFGLAFMWSRDGMALLGTSLTFLRGHFLIWGSPWGDMGERLGWFTSLSRFGWEGALLGILVVSPFVFHPPWRAERHIRPIGVAWCLVSVWTLLAQNPENLRHLLPPLTLSMIWIGVHAPLTTQALTLVRITFTLVTVSTAPRLPAVVQAAEALSEKPSGVLINRHQSRLLQRTLPSWHHVDPYYSGEHAWALHRSLPVWHLLNRTPSDAIDVTYFEPRWLGDTPLYLSPASIKSIRSSASTAP
ncbi:hypothetical protein [Saccharospirillum salsuginis]|uniref:Uncharacterized protein n=1 Tax=Saccharospirillum salsuginis TaxID=418750 RepID=A0A918KJT8_9GAMM|nr:hypothetical protein [Saccharospirillum salsuginis]GGX66170.1 hypothetical protein GCM10007392_37270 [Saccharospirillum salsuginis]